MNAFPVMYTQKKPIDNTHIVRERDRRRNRELLAVLSLGVPIGLFLLLFTWQNLEVIRLGREATRLQKTLKETDAQHKSLEATLDRLTSFDAVEKQAAPLGFKPAEPSAIVMVQSAGRTPDRIARMQSTGMTADRVTTYEPQPAGSPTGAAQPAGVP